MYCDGCDGPTSKRSAREVLENQLQSSVVFHPADNIHLNCLFPIIPKQTKTCLLLYFKSIDNSQYYLNVFFENWRCCSNCCFYLECYSHIITQIVKTYSIANGAFEKVTTIRSNCSNIRDQNIFSSFRVVFTCKHLLGSLLFV